MIMDQKTIFFVTGNIHKYKEISTIFKNQNLNYILKQKNIKTIEIQAESLKEVALYKLESIKGQLYGSYFIEDAGFFVDIPLNGFPGVYSSYVMNTIGFKGIIRLIDDFENTQAHFTTIIALYFRPLEKILIFEGEVYGKISKYARGSGGFGFDPIFLPDAIPDKTFAELSIEEKNKVSHRGQAWNRFINFLKNYDT
jgi:XTP/dITP diphosphohydrolase